MRLFLGLLLLLGALATVAAAKRVLVDDALLDAPTHKALLAAFDAHSAARPGASDGQLAIPAHLAALVMRALNTGAAPASPQQQRALKDERADGTVLVPFARGLGAVGEHHDHSVHREANGDVSVQEAEGWSGLLYLEG
jgi:hypothetical protein